MPWKQIIPDYSAGRELDALIAEKVMGMPCTGNAVHVTIEDLDNEHRAEVLSEWREKYNTEPPPDFVDDEVRDRTYSATAGDYQPMYCEKCHKKPHENIKPYSTSIAAAWSVVDKLRLSISPHENGKDWIAQYGRFDWVQADTAPLAICRAALKWADSVSNAGG